MIKVANVRNAFRRTWYCRLCWLVTLGVFASIIFIEALILGPSYINYESNRLSALDYAGQQTMRVALQTDGAATSEATLTALIDATLVKGVVLHTQPERFRGEVLPEFSTGERDLRALRRNGNGDHMDVHWPASQLELPFAVTARLDTGMIQSELQAFVWRIVGLILLITVFVTVTTMIVLNGLVLHPILQLKNRLIGAGNDPEHPLDYVSDNGRKDELGQIGEALNVMLEHSHRHLSQLRQTNARLDKQVASRTHELAEQNQQLQRRIDERDQAENKALMMARFPDENTNPVLRADQSGKLLYANHSAQPIIDCWQTQLGNKVPDHIIDLIVLALQTSWVQSVEEPCQSRHYLVHIRPVGDNEVNLYGLDISDRKRYEEELRHRIWHDDLTNLANQAALEQRVRQGALTASNSQPMALLMLGLDDFHSLNMTAGRSGGDAVLIDTADRLKQHLPRAALLARLRGDIFGVVVPPSATTDAATISTLARRYVQAMEAPFVLGDTSHQSGVSIGVVLCPADGDNSDTLLRHAEMAMLRAKVQRRQEQKEPVAFFLPELSERMAWRQARLQGLRRALSKDELTLHYQLQINAQTGGITGVEALVRWQHPDEGLISPGEFIPLAEETGLIVPLGRWVMAEACSQAAAWRTAGHNIRMAINLSAQHLLAPGLLTEVETLLKHHNLPAKMIELEITESAMIEDINRTVAVLQQLAALGIQLAVDDFGTGYSSLNYLKRLPLHRVKIDQAFVRDLPDNEQDATLCRAIIGLSHNLGYQVIAEGVETLIQVEWLTAQGCDGLQGFHFARPQPAGEVLLRRT